MKPLAGLLGAAANDAVFLDVTSIHPGDFWKSEIDHALQNASVFILCWCCASQKSEFIAYEIKAAMQSREKRLVPVLFCSAPLPGSLADRQWIDLRGRVVHACEAHELPKNAGRKAESTGEFTVAFPAMAPPAPPGGSAPRRGRWMWIGIAAPIAAAVAAVFVFKIKPAHPPYPPVNATPSVSIPIESPPQASAPTQVVYSVVLVIGLLLLLFLLKWAISGVRRRLERRRADQLAATAKSYFETLRHK